MKHNPIKLIICFHSICVILQRYGNPTISSFLHKMKSLSSTLKSLKSLRSIVLFIIYFENRITNTVIIGISII